jgi:hypothetical protein
MGASKIEDTLTAYPGSLLIKYWNFKNTNFTQALKSKNEITIHGQYVALSDKYHKLLSKHFGIK